MANAPTPSSDPTPSSPGPRPRRSRGCRDTAGVCDGVFVGLTTLDLVLGVAHAPAPDQKVEAHSQDLDVGGPAANAARTFAALGGRARLVTALGRHRVALRPRRVDLR